MYEFNFPGTSYYETREVVFEISCNWTRLHLAARIVRTNQTEGPMLQGMWKDTTLAISVLHVCTVVKHLLPIMPLALMFQESTEIQNKHLCDFISLF